MESDLSPVAQRVKAENLTYLQTEKFRRIEHHLHDVLDHGVEGDILEFGIALGGSAVVMATHGVRRGRSFHGFDVFAMIPAPTSEKDDERSKQRYEVIAAGKSKGIGGDKYYGYRDDLFGEVKATFDRYGIPVDGERIVLHKGLFEETWSGYHGQKIAFAHIDCDWYDPVAFCLKSIADRLQPGGKVVLDDYHDYGGCKRATDDFLATRSDFSVEPGRNLVLKKI